MVVSESRGMVHRLTEGLHCNIGENMNVLTRRRKASGVRRNNSYKKKQWVLKSCPKYAICFKISGLENEQLWCTMKGVAYEEWL